MRLLLLITGGQRHFALAPCRTKSRVTSKRLSRALITRVVVREGVGVLDLQLIDILAVANRHGWPSLLLLRSYCHIPPVFFTFVGSDDIMSGGFGIALPGGYCLYF